MGHAEDDFLHASRTALLDEVIQQRDEAVTPFQGKALLCRVPRSEIALEAFCCRQVAQYCLALLCGQTELGAAALEAILQPQPLIGRGDMREFRADLAAVGEFELRNDVLELLPLGIGRLTAACKIFLLEVGARQPVILELEDFRYRPLEQTERVNVRTQVATVRVHLHKAGDRRLLLGILAAGRCGSRRHNTGVPSALCQFFTNRAVRRLSRAAALQAAKVVAPTGVYGIWVGQKLFVEGFKVGGIAFA